MCGQGHHFLASAAVDQTVDACLNKWNWNKRKHQISSVCRSESEPAFALHFLPPLFAWQHRRQTAEVRRIQHPKCGNPAWHTPWGGTTGAARQNARKEGGSPPPSAVFDSASLPPLFSRVSRGGTALRRRQPLPFVVRSVLFSMSSQIFVGADARTREVLGRRSEDARRVERGTPSATSTRGRAGGRRQHTHLPPKRGHAESARRRPRASPFWAAPPPVAQDERGTRRARRAAAAGAAGCGSLRGGRGV